MVYDFCESRTGANAKEFLAGWTGSLVVDDFSGYKQLMGNGQDGKGKITEVGCWAHARRKFCDLHLGKQSQIGEKAVQQIAQIYAIEREVKIWSTTSAKPYATSELGPSWTPCSHGSA